MGEGKRGVSVTECNQSGTGPKTPQPQSILPLCCCNESETGYQGYLSQGPLEGRAQARVRLEMFYLGGSSPGQLE